MRLSAQLVLWISVVFAALCIGYGTYGLIAIDSMAEGVPREDAYGYVWFWMFMGAIGIVMAIVSWLMIRGRFGGVDE